MFQVVDVTNGVIVGHFEDWNWRTAYRQACFCRDNYAQYFPNRKFEVRSTDPDIVYGDDV